MLNLRLETTAGDCYLTAEEICYVSAPFKNKKFPRSGDARAIGMKGGQTIYVIDCAANVRALRESGIGQMIPQPVDKTARKPRKAKATAPATAPPAERSIQP